jgi:hypothetical protein
MSQPTLKWSYRLAYAAPLGLQFYDTVIRTRETRLNVLVFPETAPHRSTAAIPNRAGVFVTNRVSGLEDLLRNAADLDYWDTLSQQRSYTVRVSDPASRFIPFEFRVDLPHRGYFVPACMAMNAPPTPPAYPSDAIPLYPAPSYREPPQKAVVRAHVYDPQRGSPAAYAVIDAVYESRVLARSIADRDGKLLLTFDYPAPNGDSLDGDSSDPDQWTIRLVAHYSPYPADEPLPGFADICRTFSQADATLWEDWSESGSSNALSEVTLVYRQHQILRSNNSDEDNTLPPARLFITSTA